MAPLVTRLRSRLQRPSARWWIVALALCLGLPCLGVGYILDDHMHGFFLGLEGEILPELQRRPHELYTFIPDDPAFHRAMRDVGSMPWYANPDLHAAFLRPVSSLLLYVDHLVAPGRPFFGHLHSLIWYAILLLVVGAIFRRLFAEAWVAGLAMLLFAIDDAHATTLAWIANRNALVGMVFASLALLCHIRWRERGERLSGWLAPLCLGLGLLSSEMALSITAYLLAYALCLDGESRLARSARTPGEAPRPRARSLGRRLATLLPCAGICGVWLASYHLLGYGATGSSMYVDPLRDPVGYLTAFGPRLLALLQGQLAPVNAELLFFLPESCVWPFAAFAMLVVGSMLAVCLGLLRRSALTRFFALGMGVGALPLCATFPHDRLLLPLGIGGIGLVTQLISGAAAARTGTRDDYFRRRGVRALASLWVAVHLVLAPLQFPARIGVMSLLGRSFENAARSLDRVNPTPDRTLVYITGPDFFFTSWMGVIRHQLGLAAPFRMHILATSHEAVTITRPHRQTLLLRAPGGFLSSPFDTLMFSQDRRFEGERHRLGQIDVQIEAVTASGLPSVIRCRFPRPLEEEPFLWTVWRRDGYHPFVLPAVGQRVRVEAISFWDLLTLPERFPATR